MSHMDSLDLESLSPDASRRFWELIVQQGYHTTPVDLVITLECSDAATAERVAAHCRAARYQPVTVNQAEPLSWEVVAHTGARVLDEAYFLAVRTWTADTIRQFGCRFGSFSGSTGRAA
jgi:hypothetical protein